MRRGGGKHQENSFVALVAIGMLIALGGCAGNSHSSALAPVTSTGTAQQATPTTSTSFTSADVGGGEVVASIGTLNITRAQLIQPLIEGYGLNILAKVAQLKLAESEASARQISVTPDDVKAETDRYLATLFNEDKDPILKQLNDSLSKAEESHDTAQADRLRAELAGEREQLLAQLLQQQKVTRTDFNMVMQTNTNLRKIAQSLLAHEVITDESLRTAFNLEYGEKVQVRDIEVSNLQDATEVRRRLASGEPFEQVAREMSRNQQSAALGGELPPFNHDNPNLPQQFRDVAFGLTPGEVSDPVAVEGSYHILRLDQRIPPKIVKFEDVKEGVREFLRQRQLEAVVADLRTKLQQEVSTQLKIDDAMLKQQYDEQENRRAAEVHDRTDVRKEFDRRRAEILGTQPSTGPATAP